MTRAVLDNGGLPEWRCDGLLHGERAGFLRREERALQSSGVQAFRGRPMSWVGAGGESAARADRHQPPVQLQGVTAMCELGRYALEDILEHRRHHGGPALLFERPDQRSQAASRDARLAAGGRTIRGGTLETSVP